MTREEELIKASIEYRKSREECGVKDPILLDEVDEAFYVGGGWADKTMLDKACKWLEENAGSYLLYPFCEYDKGALVEDFRKAMEDKEL